MTTALIVRSQNDPLPKVILADRFTHQFDSYIAPLCRELQSSPDGDEVMQIMAQFRHQIPHLAALCPEKRAQVQIPFWSGKKCTQMRAAEVPQYLENVYKTLVRNQERDWTLVSKGEVLDQNEGSSLLASIRDFWSRPLSRWIAAGQQSSSEQPLQEVEQMKGKTQKGIDSTFQDDLVRDYKKGNKWQLQKLRTQIERDLPRLSFKLNGEAMLSFSDVCRTLGIAETIFDEKDSRVNSDIEPKLMWMAMMHQGAAAKGLELASQKLNGVAGLIVGEASLPPKRKEVIELAQKFLQRPNEREKTRQEALILGQDSRAIPYLRSAISSRALPADLLPPDETGEALPSLHPTRIEFYTAEGSLYAEQELELRDPAQEQAPHPILTKTFWKQGKPALVQWGFV